MNGRRILVMGGMLLVLAGAVYAATYWAFFSLPFIKRQVLNLELVADMAAKGQGEMARGYIREFAATGRNQILHELIALHFIGTGLTALGISSFMRALELKKKWEKILSYLLILGGMLSGSGFFMQLLGYTFYGWGIALLGYTWMIAGVLGYAIALFLSIIAKPEV